MLAAQPLFNDMPWVAAEPALMRVAAALITFRYYIRDACGAAHMTLFANRGAQFCTCISDCLPAFVNHRCHTEKTVTNSIIALELGADAGLAQGFGICLPFVPQGVKLGSLN